MFYFPNCSLSFNSSSSVKLNCDIILKLHGIILAPPLSTMFVIIIIDYKVTPQNFDNFYFISFIKYMLAHNFCFSSILYA